MLYQVNIWRKYRWHNNTIKKSKMKKQEMLELSALVQAAGVQEKNNAVVTYTVVGKVLS